MKIGFIGTGQITKAVVTGIVNSKLKVSKIFISERNKKIYTENKDPDEVKNAEKTLLTHFLNKIN